MLGNFMEIFLSFLAKLNEKLLAILATNEKFTNILFETFKLLLITNKQIPDCIISTCGINAVDDSINEIKSKIIEILIKLVPFSAKTEDQREKLGIIFEIIFNSLRAFSNQSNQITGVYYFN